MKNIFLIAVLCISGMSSFAQEKGYIAISLGPSIPIGDFNSKNINNTSAGWAKPGAIFDISIAYRLGKNFGLSGLLRGQANAIDNVAFCNEFANQVGGSWSLRSKPWSIGGLMFGGYGTFPVRAGIFFETKAMIGFLNAESPELNLTLDGTGGAGWVKQSSESAISFSYLIGAGFKFNTGRKICLIANLDYLGSKPEFRDVEVVSSAGGVPQKSTSSQKFGTINFGLGVGLRL